MKRLLQFFLLCIQIHFVKQPNNCSSRSRNVVVVKVQSSHSLKHPIKQKHSVSPPCLLFFKLDTISGEFQLNTSVVCFDSQGRCKAQRHCEWKGITETFSCSPWILFCELETISREFQCAHRDICEWKGITKHFQCSIALVL